MTIISLGAGVQSSTMFLMSCLGELPKVDRAIFADTGAEPKAVYDHLEYLTRIGKEHGIPVDVVSHANLEEALLNPEKRLGAIPWFIINPNGTNGLGRRQCTNEYKLKPLKRRVRELLKESEEKQAEMWIGISTDEVQRMRTSGVKYIRNHYPLIDMRASRQDCLLWYNSHDFRTPPRSACVFCPYHNDREWVHLRDDSPDEFQRAVEIDRFIRKRPKFNGENFLHAERVPLDQVDFREEDERQLDLFGNDCEGMCGI